MNETRNLDVIIVGAGLAGLCAAYRLRDRRILVLESSDRPGGRILSLPRGDYWLNLGAHMFGGPGSTIGDLVAELHLDSRRICGELLGISFCNRRLFRGRLETYPFRLPLSLRDRASFIRMGLNLRFGVTRAVAAMKERPNETPEQQRARLLAFDNGRTLISMVGRLSPKMRDLLFAITERTGASPDEMAAGYGLFSFTNVWSSHSPGHNLFGGSVGLPNALANRIRERLVLDANVHIIRQTSNNVIVQCKTRDGTKQFEAYACIVATPAFVTKQIVEDLPPAIKAALSAIRYGPFLTAALRTKERSKMPWDNNYAVCTPERSFSVLFNQATTLRGLSATRAEGGSLMLFRGGRGAASLIQESDTKIEQVFIGDLEREFPEAKGIVGEMVIKRWEAGAPFSWPGRALLQSGLTSSAGRIILAGDYLEFPNMEAAAKTGYEAAHRARQFLLERAYD